MNLNRLDGIALVNDTLRSLCFEVKVEVVFAPSFVHLYKVGKMCAKQENIFSASQNCSTSPQGPFTGEVSAEMIASCGARYVILGHSERRCNFRETNESLTLKVRQALANNLKVIFCCGESLDQRSSGEHFDWVKRQISESLFDLSASDFSNIVIAYEPIWAIGTGITATSAQAQEIHHFIRSIITERYGSDISQNAPILYGGSCNPSNAVELFAQEDIDGGLIGGASLNAADFVSIINSF